MSDDELRRLWLAANERLERQGYFGGELAETICAAIPRLLAEKERLRTALAGLIYAASNESLHGDNPVVARRVLTRRLAVARAALAEE